MNLDWKKLGIIILFVAAVALFAFLVYYFFFKPTFIPETPDEAITTIDQLPTTIDGNGNFVVTTGGGQLPFDTDVTIQLPPTATPTNTAQGSLTQTTVLTDQPINYVTSGSDGKLIYYNPIDGLFYRLSADGQVSVFHDQVFHNVSDVTWSNNRSMAILEYPDQSKIVYDFGKSKQITLPKHWEEFDFSPSDQQIIFKSVALNKENRFLTVAKNDGSQAKSITGIGGVENQFNVNWSPNNQMIATFIEGKDFDRSKLYFIGLNDENFRLMVVEGRDFRGQWSPQGDRMLYSVYNSQDDYKPQLWVSDALPGAVGNNRRKINLETWGDKCTFADNDRVFCAVPSSLPYGAGLDSTIADEIPDQIFEIDLSAGTKKMIALPNGSHSIDQIILTDSSNYLFFTDKNDGHIYRINLR